jgi:uncharacterized protein (DUF983 family)
MQLIANDYKNNNTHKVMTKKETDKCGQEYSNKKNAQEKTETVLFTILTISAIVLPILMGVSFLIKSHTLLVISEIDLVLMVLTGVIMVEMST